MTLAELHVFGLTVPGLVVVFAGVTYVVSLVRDWRPMKSLRQENRDLRNDLADALQKLDDDKAESGKKISELENELTRMKRATDLSPIAEQQVRGIAVLEELVKEIKSLDGSVRANTAAVETLSKRRIIDEALDDHEGDRSA